ncbi:hypothetical protein [Brunnivagina elsteri]|uniref:hypothetical protein n=1 Tax=Brunnivagina elsteri TaxID=1247191 RepID=UPI00130436A0|nr:hypothetical protein [Calothrix elsteri]
MENFPIIHPDIQIISEYHPVLRQYAEFFQIPNYDKTPKELDGTGSGCNTPQILSLLY